MTVKTQHIKICETQVKQKEQGNNTNAYLRKEENSQSNNLSSHLMNLEKEKQSKPKGRKRKKHNIDESRNK